MHRLSKSSPPESVEMLLAWIDYHQGKLMAQSQKLRDSEENSFPFFGADLASRHGDVIAHIMSLVDENVRSNRVELRSEGGDDNDPELPAQSSAQEQEYAEDWGAAMAEVHQAQKRVAKKRALHRRNRSTQNIIRASPTSSKPSIVSSSKSNASPRSPMWKKGTATASSLAKRVNKVPVQKKHRNANEKNSKIEKSSRKRATLTAAAEEYQNLPFEVRMNRAEEKRRLNILRLKRQQWERHRAIMAPEERLNKPTQSSSVSTKTRNSRSGLFLVMNGQRSSASLE